MLKNPSNSPSSSSSHVFSMVQPVEAGPASLPEESGVQVRHLDDLCAVVSLGKSGDKRERESGREREGRRSADVAF